MKEEVKQTRRTNGSGSVYQSKDGRFGAAISLGTDKNGKRGRKVITGKTQEEVITKMKSYVKKNYIADDEDTVSMDAETPVSEFVHEFKMKVLMKNVEEGSVSSRTYENYEYALSIFANYFSDSLIGEINTRRLNMFFAAMIKEDKSQATINRVLNLVTRMYVRACKRKYLEVNPFDDEDFRKPKSKHINPEVTALTEEELVQINDTLKKNPIIYPVFKLMLTTGIRTQEALGLHWSDIDFDEGTVNIWRAITVSAEYDSEGNRLGRSTILGSTKTNRSRELTLTEDAVELLKEWRMSAPSISQTKTGNEDYVFGNSKKSSWTYAGFRCSVNRALSEGAGSIDHLALHRVRHTVATILAEDGGELFELMQQLGHTQTKTTMRYIDKASKRVAKANQERLQRGLLQRLGEGNV